jgi:hypothetical protein
MDWRQVDPRGQLSAVAGDTGATGTAGGAGNNTQVSGNIIDRKTYNLPKSALAVICGGAALASGKTLTAKSVQLLHGDASNLSDSSVFASVSPDTVVGTGPSGGGTVAVAQEFPIDLRGAKRYIQLVYTPNLNATGTDTFVLSSVVVFAGEMSNPAA